MSSVSFVRAMGPAATFLVAVAWAQATPVNLSEAGSFNLLTWGNASLLNSDAEGTVAIGGNATFNQYSVGTKANQALPTDASLVVGGNLTAGNGQVYNGSIYVGGTYSGPGYSLNSAAGSVTQAGLGLGVPFDFAGARTALTAKSESYGAEASTGTSLLQWSTLTLTGSNTDLNVFNISAADLAAASTLTIDVAANSHVLINISGSSATFSNKGIDGTFAATNTLFNFYQATSLNMSGIGVEGSILAPHADVSFLSGQMNGQLIANSFSGASWGVGELHNYPFNNQPPTSSVPDAGSSLTLVLTALGMIALFARRGAGRKAGTLTC
ncbi:MAG TPA: choice-of-anchor A family protein [Opitutaceae bacterium]|nr:choice-of-anchor A family protein [Opitutaceae bacterium]